MLTKKHNDKAKWVNTGGWISCSACGSEPPENETTPYCPWCGADMLNADRSGLVLKFISFQPSNKYPNLNDYLKAIGERVD